jgi:hypothetical protein
VVACDQRSQAKVAAQEVVVVPADPLDQAVVLALLVE